MTYCKKVICIANCTEGFINPSIQIESNSIEAVNYEAMVSMKEP